MPRKTPLLVLGATCGAGLLLTIAGCASAADDPAPAATGSAGSTTIRVSTLGFCDDPIVWGVDQGIFAEHGLEVELTTLQSGAAGVSALQAGEIDIAYANPLTSLQAIDGGVALQIVSGSSLSNADSNAVIVAADSELTSAAQLDGATIALNALGGLPEALTAQWLADEGDGAEAEYVAVPFADQVTSVVNGTVEAAEVSASQTAEAIADGSVRSLGNPFHDSVGEIPTSFYIASGDYIEQNETAAAAFATAMTEVAASASDPADDEARLAVTAEACGSTVEDLENATEPGYVGQLDKAAVQKLIDILAAAGATETTSADDVLPSLAEAP